MGSDIDGNKEGLGRTRLCMSGIDEQNVIFECPNCGEIEYWVLRGWDEKGERDTLLGFLNNPNMSMSPLFEIMPFYKDWFLHAVLRNINRIYCDGCSYLFPSDGFKWKRIIDKIEELWKGRVII